MADTPRPAIDYLNQVSISSLCEKLKLLEIGHK